MGAVDPNAPTSQKQYSGGSNERSDGISHTGMDAISKLSARQQIRVVYAPKKPS
jgi:hypothetical protein